MENTKSIRKFSVIATMLVLLLTISFMFIGCDTNNNQSNTDNSSTQPTVVTPTTYNLTLNTQNANYGTVYGAGTYAKNEQITIYAVAKDGYNFSAWSDGNTNAVRVVNMTENKTLTANFVEKTKYLTLKGFDLYPEIDSSAASDLALYYEDILAQAGTKKLLGSDASYFLGFSDMITLYNGVDKFTSDTQITYYGGRDDNDNFVYGRNAIDFNIKYCVYENGSGNRYNTGYTVQFNLFQNNLTPTVTIVSGNGWAIKAKLYFEVI